MTVLAIVGPTASGKSELAVRLARARTEAALPTEIVAVDAFTVYRGMDIGTAKAPEPDRRAVRHHLVDVCDPGEDLSVAAFQRMARTAIADVVDRGATPLLVGGSGLYWRAVVDDLRFPPTDAEVRARLEARWSDDPAGAHALLAERDPQAASRIDPANLRRTVRALEVIEVTGLAFSSFRAAWDRYESIYAGLHVRRLDPPDGELRERMRRRAQVMVERGLVDEARSLLRAGGLSRTARQAIGYAEAIAVVEDRAPLETLADEIARRTWRYARRQLAWFRADPRAEVARPDDVVRDWLTLQGSAQ